MTDEAWVLAGGLIEGRTTAVTRPREKIETPEGATGNNKANYAFTQSRGGLKRARAVLTAQSAVVFLHRMRLNLVASVISVSGNWVPRPF